MGRGGPALSYVRQLADPGAELAEVGGKAWPLARLSAAGLPVPPGFVITTAAYDDFAGADELPPEIAEPILMAYRELGSGPVAVRSSATAEDLPGLSFAGQQDTFLNVTGESDLLAAVRRCWASLGNEWAVAYREREGSRPPG